METKAAHAWIIHKNNSGETSINLTLFTAERGLIICLYKGGRTLKKQAILHPFTPIWVFIKTYPTRNYVQRIEHEAPTMPLSGEALISGIYINELLYRILPVEVPCQPLFEAYLITLRGLAFAKNRQEIEPLLRRFEWTLLDTCGYSISLTQEAKTQQPIEAENYYQFVDGLGLINASHGLPGSHIIAISQDQLTDPDTLKVAKFLMRKAINSLLEGVEIKARNLYNHSL
jgi:DNA repair protein RecO (recombination protein O)